MKKIALATCLALAALTGTAAAVPTTMSFTARLTNTANVPIEGAVDLHVAIFDAPTAGTLVWEETHTALTATRGLVYANLGSVDAATNGLDASVFGGSALFIELTVDGDVLSPRIPIASVPYAVKAGVAETLEGFDPSTVQNRVASACAAGSSIRQINTDGTVICQTDTTGGVGTITSVAGTGGLTGGGSAGAVTLTVDTAAIQARVASTCAAGSSIRQINANGTVVCQTDTTGGVGTITSVAGSGGLTGGGSAGAVTLTVDTAVIQARVATACAAGSSIRQINANGTVVCQTDTTGGVGTITSVTGNGGLTGSGSAGAVTLSIATGGVTTTQLLDGTVGAADLGANSVTTAKIATGAVTMSKTDAPVGYAALTSTAADIYPSPDFNFTENGSCMVSVQAFALSGNSSFYVKPVMLHVSTNSSMAPAERGPSSFSSTGNNSGYYASSTAVMTTNQLGQWRFGCLVGNAGGSNIDCRVSWLCN